MEENLDIIFSQLQKHVENQLEEILANGKSSLCT